MIEVIKFIFYYYKQNFKEKNKIETSNNIVQTKIIGVEKQNFKKTKLNTNGKIE